MNEVDWYVAHTRPRREKKLAEFCTREVLEYTLPLYSSVKRYRGKTLVFRKPLFPGYIFLKLDRDSSTKVRQNQHVANLLEVPDQAEFEHQLADILRALDSGVEVRLAPEIKVGMRVKIKSGPLRGLEAWVQDRAGLSEVILRLDFIGQAAVVSIKADELEET